MRVRRATIDDLEFIRETRNAGRYNMTRDTSLIRPHDSEVWWASKPNVWIAEDDGTRVGYAVLRQVDGDMFISLAVAPEQQGKGYGTLIYRHFHPLVKAEIWTWNHASRRAAEKAGSMGSWRPPRSTRTASCTRAGRPKSNSSLITARVVRPV